MITMGTVMEIERSKALVFTIDGNVVYVKPRLDFFVGQQIAFTKREVVTAKKRLLAVLPYAAMAAALLVVACIATGMFGMSGLLTQSVSQQCAAYIALDINPSVQFKIDEEGRVLNVSALNDDGKALLKGLDLAGKLVKQAVDEAIAKAKELGYIQNSGGVVLVAGTLNDGNSSVSGRRSDYRAKLESILGSMGNSAEADVLALYIDDSSVKENADRNNLSLGRELLREYAAQNNIDIQEDEFRNGKINSLIDRLDPQKCLPIVTGEPTATSEATATAKPTEKPTSAPTDAPTEKPTEAPTPKPTEKPAVTVSAKAYGTGIQVSWKKAPDTGSKFLHYKVVFSAKDSTPRYPENGYVKAISDIGTLSAVVKPGAACSGGDFGSVKAGATYYVSVTYVYEKGALYGNAVRVKCPAAPDPTKPPSSGFNGTVNASASGDHINISWDKAPTKDGFCYYKVVLSVSDSTPRYPDNGYLHAISNINDTSCTAKPGECYNCGDFDKLQAGVTYYISVTYVYGDKKLYGGVKRVKMPGTAASTTDPREGFVGTVNASASGSKINISWAKAPTSKNFCYYKVVMSKSDSTPRYPDNGYLYAICSLDDTSCAASPGQCYNGGDGGFLEAGRSYYISVTYVYSDKKIYGSVKKVTMPGAAPTATPLPAFGGGSTHASIDGSTLTVSWTKLPADSVTYGGAEYKDFQFYKVVFSGSANPKYPGDPHIDVVSSRGTGSTSISLPHGSLESGKKYYFSVTYVFCGDKYIYAGDAAVTIP